MRQRSAAEFGFSSNCANHFVDNNRRHGRFRRPETSRKVEDQLHNARPEHADLGLAFEVQPPSYVVVGAPIEHAVQVTARTSSHGHKSAIEAILSGHIVAVVSLISAAYSAVAPGVLAGTRLADTVCPLGKHSKSSKSRTEAIGQATFLGLSIMDEGAYRLRVSVMQLTNASSCSSGYQTIQVVDSDLIVVGR